MTVPELKQIVLAEIGNQTSFFGLSFETCLVEPYLELCSFQNTAGQEIVEEVWVLFEEEPDKKSGYVVIFDETDLPEHPFALAIWNKEKSGLDYLSSYPTFLSVLEGM